MLGLAAAMVAISLAGFVTERCPTSGPPRPSASAERWGYPIGYWNALGMAAALAMVFCLHLTCSARESRAGAAGRGHGDTDGRLDPAVHVLARAPGACAAGGWSPTWCWAAPAWRLTGLIAAVPATAMAVMVSYEADFAARSGMGQVFRPLTPTELARPTTWR